MTAARKVMSMPRRRMVLIAGASLALVLVGSFFSFARSNILARPVLSGTPVTSGASYDRNAEPLVDGATTWLFFARTEQACNRLDGCANDESTYDLYYQQSKDRGATWGPATLLAANPQPSIPFYGRTIAPVRTADGTLYVLWASGGNSNNLYYLSKAPGGSWSALSSLSDAAYFNVESAAVGNTVYVYYEDGLDYGVHVRTLAHGVFSAPQLVAAGLSIPKVLIDKGGMFRMALVDGGSGSVYVASSADGLAWTSPVVVPALVASGSVTNWDPVLGQTANGRYYLFAAPDLGGSPDIQHIAQVSSADFATWTTEATTVTPGTDGTTGYWDYWPETLAQGNTIRLFYTSEAATPSSAVGIGHIWSAELHLDNGCDGGSKSC